MIRAALLALALFATPAFAREALGVTGDWGAFRDARPLRCFAIAEPVRGGKARPFASVAHWPAQRVRSQLHFRLSREKRRGAPVTLRVDDRRFPLTGNGFDAWAPDARTDAAIVAAMRSGRSMSVATIGKNGGFADGYRLKGAATAIDAAAIGCARVR
jgi:hypothetical protein